MHPVSASNHPHTSKHYTQSRPVHRLEHQECRDSAANHALGLLLLFHVVRKLTCIIQQRQEGHAGCNLPNDGLDLGCDLFVRLFRSLPACNDHSVERAFDKHADTSCDCTSPSMHNSLVCQEIKGPSLKNLSCLTTGDDQNHFL